VTEAVAARPSAREVWTEIAVLYFGTLLAIKLVVALVQGLGLPDLLYAASPLLFMYTPVWACRWRGADPWAYPMALPALADRRVWLDALGWLALFAAILFVPFVLGYHLWQTELVPYFQHLLHVRFYPHPPALQWTWPSNPLKLVAHHLFFAAIPEEMFYRGYVQTRLNELYPKRWRIFGTEVGPGLLITCVIFAFGHSLVVVQWWHVFIILPSLAFGWLRERTDNIVAGAFFHAWCNVTVATLDTLYGIVAP
jgi:hypothetical protein